MRGLAFGTSTDFHGIQCGIATLIAAKVYEQVKDTVPNRERALEYVKNFDIEKWNESLLKFVGPGAQSMIALEKIENKYSVSKHKSRFEKIIANWDKILKIIGEEVIPSKEVEKILDAIGAPKTCTEIGIDKETLPMTFKASKDIRDKYVLSRLCWDLGILDSIKY